MLNQRRVTLLRSLLMPNAEKQSVANLALQLGVSERLIRYDLEEIDRWLCGRGGQLRSDARGSIEVSGDLERIAVDLQAMVLAEKPPADYVLTPQERCHWILAALLEASEPVGITDLADRLNVSRGTVYTDLKAVETWLARHGVQLDKRRYEGVLAVGPESALREAIVRLAVEQIGVDQLVLLVAQWEQTGQWETALRDLPSPLFLQAAHGALRAVEAFIGFDLADAWFAEAVLHLAVALQRVSQGKTAEASPGPPPESPEWQAVRMLVEHLEALSGTAMPAAETPHLARLLQQAEFRLRLGSAAMNAMPEAVRLATRFVATAESLLGVNLSQDVDLIPALSLHLRPIRHRLARQVPIVNPLLDSIRQQYPELYAAAQKAARSLEQAWGLPVPADEIGFLTMHLGAALERLRVTRLRRFRAVAVCTSGVGTARLLATRLEAALPEVELVAVTSLLALRQSLTATPCDLVIATCPVPALDVPVVNVSPLLSPGDLRAIRQVLETCSKADPLGKRDQPMLTEVLTPDVIRVDVNANDWEAAVRAAGQVLVDGGAVQPSYVDAMVEAVRRIGPYIVIAPGVAMPHARPEDGVNRLAMSMIRLRSPVAFGHPANDPVSLVFALASVDVDSHLKALSQLSNLLSVEEYVARLKSARDAAEAWNVVVESISERK